jgi:GAF domain-containing protein
MEKEINPEILFLEKEERYKEMLSIIRAVIENEKDMIANMANVAAILKELFSFLWVGFYLIKEKELVLGPFQGPLACTRIQFGKGVCGTAWEKKEILLVPDVNKFPGHIACNSKSSSEIVVPLIHDNEVWAVLDIDSSEIDSFSPTDSLYLNKLGELLSNQTFK